MWHSRSAALIFDTAGATGQGNPAVASPTHPELSAVAGWTTSCWSRSRRHRKRTPVVAADGCQWVVEVWTVIRDKQVGELVKNDVVDDVNAACPGVDRRVELSRRSLYTNPPPWILLC